jgi:hypothetical protein
MKRFKSNNDDVLYEISADRQGNAGWPPRTHPFLHHPSGQMIKDDVNVFFLHLGYLLHASQSGLETLQPQSTYFPRDETGLVCLPTQLERTLQLYW